jgi:serine/threonine protein kinase
MTGNALAWEDLPVGHPIVQGWTKSATIGVGGMSIVLEAQKAPDMTCAFKLLKPAVAAIPGVLVRFAQEGALTVKLEHPHIVRVLDCDVLPDRSPYLRMERLQGETLLKVTQEARALQRTARGKPTSSSAPSPCLPAAKVFSIVKQICEGLAYAHAHSPAVVHRDIKPANIFLHQPLHAPDLQVKLLDFGIAAVLGGSLGASDLVGSPPYMSPQAARGEAPTPLCDIYGLTMLIYGLLTSRSPFPMPIRSYEDVLQAHDKHRPVPPSHWARWIGPSIDEILLRGLSFDPARRPRDVYELLDGLKPLESVNDGSAMYQPADAVLTDPDPAALVAGAPTSSTTADPPEQGPNWIDAARVRQLQSPAPGVVVPWLEPAVAGADRMAASGRDSSASNQASLHVGRNDRLPEVRVRQARRVGPALAMMGVGMLALGVGGWKAVKARGMSREAPRAEAAPVVRPVQTGVVPEADRSDRGPSSASGLPAALRAVTSHDVGREAGGAPAQVAARVAAGPTAPRVRDLASLDDVIFHRPAPPPSLAPPARARKTLDDVVFRAGAGAMDKR